MEDSDDGKGNSGALLLVWGFWTSCERAPHIHRARGPSMDVGRLPPADRARMRMVLVPRAAIPRLRRIAVVFAEKEEENRLAVAVAQRRTRELHTWAPLHATRP